MATSTTAGTASETGIAKAHRIIAFVFLAGVAVQFFLAGVIAFRGEGRDAHGGIGSLLGLVSLLLLALAAIGRKEALQASAALFVLMIVQSILGAVGEDSSVAAGLHPVNALLILAATMLVISGSPLRFGHGRRAAPPQV